jgi:hypothetical protein
VLVQILEGAFAAQPLMSVYMVSSEFAMILLPMEQSRVPRKEVKGIIEPF